jgi:hypothetical protein
MNDYIISLGLIVVLILPGYGLSAFSTFSTALYRQGTVLRTGTNISCLAASSSNTFSTANNKQQCTTPNESTFSSMSQNNSQQIGRRLFFQMAGGSMGAAVLSNQSSFAATAPKLETLLSQVIEARSQLDPIPRLIKEEKWDSIRAILVTPPLSDCWSKTSKLLNSYATAIGDEIPDGDELAALELKEDALDHLRFLDMAVYNNVFNPIKTEGESGATKTLISSYYDDPMNEVS